MLGDIKRFIRQFKGKYWRIITHIYKSKKEIGVRLRGVKTILSLFYALPYFVGQLYYTSQNVLMQEMQEKFYTITSKEV